MKKCNECGEVNGNYIERCSACNAPLTKKEVLRDIRDVLIDIEKRLR